jgi:uncharacterized membrane protein
MYKKIIAGLTSNGILIFLLLFAADISIALNVPILRQILGIILLTVLPGLLILITLKLDKLGIAERVVLVIGTSVAFLMLFGWALNQLLLQFNYTKPLATGILMVAINLALIFLAAGAYLRNKKTLFSSQHRLEINTTSGWFVLISSALPLVSILGTNLLNKTGNNSLLLVLLFAIPILVVFFSIFNRRISPNTYPLSLIMISAAVLFMFWLRSDHILGNDINSEYYFFQMTLNNGHWAIIGSSSLDSCLSISLLPAIFQSIIHFSGAEYLFKGVYALICAFTPLTVYIISKKYVGEKFGFLAAFYFLSQSSFLLAPGSARTNLAIFFFGLGIMTLFLDGITNTNRKALFLTFIVATVVSHYSTTYIFFFLLFLTLILNLVVKKYSIPKSVTWASVAFLAVFGFLWYSQLVPVNYILAIHFVQHALISFQNFFVQEARSSDLGYLFGYGIKRGIELIWVQSAATWLSFLLIAIGVLGIFIKYKDMLVTSNSISPTYTYLRSKFETDYFIMGIVGAMILVASLVIPWVSVGYDLIRVYEQTAIILSVFLVVGGILLSKLIRINGHVILLAILIPYFLFTTFAAYEVFGIHETYILSPQSPSGDYEVINDQEAAAAQWLKNNMDGNSTIHTPDYYSGNILISQGLISESLIDNINFYFHSDTTGYIYLSTYNVVDHKLIVNDQSYDIRKFTDILNTRDKIYTNGSSEIYK